MKRRPWTDAERDLLRAHYADTPTAELAARMGRSVKTVYSVAYKLGLRKSGTYFAAGLGGRAGDGRGTATRFQPGRVTLQRGAQVMSRDRANQIWPVKARGSDGRKPTKGRSRRA